jgi:hypothetical protein
MITTPRQPPLSAQPAPQPKKRDCPRLFPILIGIFLGVVIIAPTPILSGTPENDIVGGSGSPTPAQQAQSKQQLSDVSIIPGTRWMLAIVKNPNGFGFCTIQVKEEAGERVLFTVGARGTLALQIEDEYLENQISSVLPWLEPGQSYSAMLSLTGESESSYKRFYLPAMRISEHALLVELKSIDNKTLSQTKEIGLAVGAIAMRGYKVEGLGIAIPELQNCARQLRKAKQAKSHKANR